MQVGQTQVVRNEWYDRSIEVKGFTSVNAYAPHATVVRSSLIVPVNRVLKTGLISVEMIRRVAATTSGEVTTVVNISDSTGLVVSRHYTTLNDNNVGAISNLNVGCNLRIPAGGNIFITTEDLSIGGNVVYRIGVSGTEYDA